MLALARILRTGARLLLLDEISEGLAPVIVQALSRTIQQLRATGLHHRHGRNRISASPPRWPTASTSWSTGGSWRAFAAGELQDKMAMLHQYLGV